MHNGIHSSLVDIFWSLTQRFKSHLWLKGEKREMLHAVLIKSHRLKHIHIFMEQQDLKSFSTQYADLRHFTSAV